MTTSDLVGKLRERVFESRPIFGKIVKKHGSKTLAEYARHFLEVRDDPKLDSRRPICLHVIYKEVQKRLGEKVADDVERQLLQKPLVSTTEHHAFIQHPFWLNTALVTALPYVGARKKFGRNLVVFSFASVSMNNASGYPRGLILHGGEAGEKDLIKIPIFPDKVKMRTVYGMEPFNTSDIEKARKFLMEKVREGAIGKKRAEQVDAELLSEFAKEEILNCDDYAQQITKLNYSFWPKFFADSDVPNLIYIEAETMVREILIQEVLLDSACILSEMFFDKKVRDLFLKYFDGVPGAFSAKDEWGTYFFWTFDEKGHRVSLVVEGDKLISKNKNLEVDLTAEGLTEALKSKKIFPSMMTVYMVLSLHYGFKCLGGFSQVHDLTRMKEALMHVLVEMGEYREIQSVSRIQTKEFGGDGITLAYIKNERGLLEPATGIDLLFAEKKFSMKDYRTLAEKVTFEEMIDPMLPEMFTVLYPSYTRVGTPEESLTAEQIIRDRGMQKKLDEFFSSH